MPAWPPVGGPTVNSYVAQAVHFDGSSFLAATIGDAGHNLNSPIGAFSVWVKPTASTYNAFLAAYAVSSGVPNLSAGWSAIAMGFNFSTDLGVGLEMFPGNFAGAGSDNGLIVPNQWGHVFISWNTNFPTNEKIINVYWNGVSVLNPTNNADTTAGATPVQWSFYASPDFSGYLSSPDAAIGLGFTFPTDFADLQLWIGTYIDPSQVSKFRDTVTGKPVNPSVAQAAFGQSQVLFSGDASSTGYKKNQGSYGDIFTLTGSLTNASTSPSS